MLFDELQSPPDRFVATRMQIPADADFTKEQGHIGIMALKKNFAMEYETLDHPCSLRNQRVEAACRSAPYPSLHALTATMEELRVMDIVRRTGRAVKADVLPPKGSTAELMQREAREEVVFSGPEYLYREPRCNAKCSKMLLGSPVDVSSVPTRSRPIPFGNRDLVASFSNRMSKDRARRDCAAAMLEIVSGWEARRGQLSPSAAAGRFLDAAFFLGHRSSLYPAGTLPDSHVPEPRDLISLFQLFPNVDLFHGGEGDDDEEGDWGVEGVEQFVVPVCRSTHLVAAAESISGLPKGRALLRDLFVVPPVAVRDGGAVLSPSAFIRRYGFVGVMLFVNGAWDWVIVDDLVATDVRGASPSMLHLVGRAHMHALQGLFGPLAREGAVRGRLGVVKGRAEEPLDGGDDPVELWPHLLQKAAAKWYGCYDAIDGGSPGHAMVLLTGGTLRQGAPVAEDDMGAFDAFDDACSGQPCLVYLGKEGRTDARREYHAGTDTFLFHPRRAQHPAWLPRRLPLVLCGCYTSSDDATPMVRLASPWGSLSADGSTSVDMQWSEFINLCDFYELCLMPDPNEVYVEGYGVSRPAFTHSFSFSLKAPLRAPVALSLRQSDPRSQFDLPLEVRRRLPFVGMSISVTEAISRAVVYQTKPAERVVALEHTVDLRLLPGEYTVRLSFDEQPSVPFAFRVSASTLVSICLWPTGLHPEVNGAVTPKVQLVCARDDEPVRLIDKGPPPLASSGAGNGGLRLSAQSDNEGPPLSEVVAVFESVDVVDRGVLDVRGAERAAAEYFFAYTEEGRRLRAAIAARASQTDAGTVSLAAFSAIINGTLGRKP